MRRNAFLAAVISSLAVLAPTAVPSASAATQVGNSCVATRAELGLVTLLQLADPGSPTSVAIPGGGVITRWGVNVIPYPGGISEKAVVFRPVAGMNMFTVAGESTMQPIVGGANSFETRIPVRAGDRLGASSGSKAIYCEEGVAGNAVGYSGESVATGSTVAVTELAGDQVAISATVEPDADGDGFGDETQDRCPTSAAVQTACPVPVSPPVPLLSGTTSAKRGLVNVFLTSSVQSTVTVAGSVRLGKGKSAKLRGGTQIVVPGALAKFVVLFPGKLKARLKGLAPRRSVALKLSATAPGATAKQLTVKVAGQAQPKPPRGGG